MSLTPLGDALSSRLKQKAGLKKQVENSEVLEVAEQVFIGVFGSSGAAHTKPLFIKNKTLTITCSNSAIAQEIRLNQLEIVEKINQKLGKKEIDRIRYLA